VRLVYKDTQQEVKVGDFNTLDSTGETVKVISFQKPHKPSSSGKVVVEFVPAPGNTGAIGTQQEYYVSVIGAEWIEREDRGEAPKTFTLPDGYDHNKNRRMLKLRNMTEAEIRALRPG